MSYHFKDSGYPGEDYLIVTKKGKEEGNLPDGIILLGGLMYCDMDFRNWIREAEQNRYYVYPAKHCNDKFPYGKPQTDEVARGSGTESMAVRD